MTGGSSDSITGPPRDVAGSSPPELTPAKVDALIRLLADDDPRIQRVARDHLKVSIDLARPLLEERCRGTADPRVQVEARRFLLDVLREEKLAEWVSLSQAGEQPDLERGAFLIAEIEYPDLCRARYLKMLDDYATVLEGRISFSRDPDSMAAKLNHLLFRERGLQGNRENYFDPDNSYLPRVLERRLGIPISLSVVAMLVSRRVGFELEGVGMPGHFLLRYRKGRSEVFLDAFNGGRIWTLEDCLHYLRAEGYGFREEHVRTYGAREILTRMLANLLHIYRSREDETRENRITAMLEALHPGS